MMVKAFKWFLLCFLNPMRLCYWHGEREFCMDWGGGGWHCFQCQSERENRWERREKNFKEKVKKLNG